MTDAQAGQQRVDGSNLNPAAAAPVAEFGRLDVIVTVWDQQRQRRESIDNPATGARTGKALQQLLQHKPGRDQHLAGFDGAPQFMHFRRRRRGIAPERQGPDAGIDEQVQPRERSAL